MATNVDGGVCTSNLLGVVRTMNTLSGDLSFATLANDTLSLDEGTYIVDGEAPASYALWHRAFLQNETTGVVAISGSSEYVYPSNYNQTSSSLRGFITVPAGEVQDFTLRHWCSTYGPPWGLGYAANLAGQPEIYAQLVFTKIQ